MSNFAILVDLAPSLAYRYFFLHGQSGSLHELKGIGARLGDVKSSEFPLNNLMTLKDVFLRKNYQGCSLQSSSIYSILT